MPRYSPNQNSDTNQRRRLKRSPRIEALSANHNYKPIWQNPLTWVGIGGAIFTLLFPIWLDSKTVKLISIHASDASDSGIANPAIPQEICKARTERLIIGDLALNFDFSDRTEPTYTQVIDQNTELGQQCHTLFTNGKQRPKEISKREGTDPVSLIVRIQNAINAERAKGDHRPVVVTIWLDAAEPIPGAKPYDFDDFQKRVEAIVSDRGKVAIIGTSGELRENLEKRFTKNPSVYLCNIQGSNNCIRDTFEAARKQS